MRNKKGRLEGRQHSRCAAPNLNMASTVVHSFTLNQLFRDISTKFSPLEPAEVVKSSKRIYGEQFCSLQNEDLLSCFGLLQKFGYVSNSKLTLIKDFVASKSSNKEEISEAVESFTASHPLLYDPEKQLHGRNDDLKRITATLEAGQLSVVNLHGPGGVGKTVLAQEISSKWRGGKQGFPLRANAHPRRTVWLKNGKGTQNGEENGSSRTHMVLGW